MVRILTLAEFYPPIIGGLEGVARNLSVELQRRGHFVAVATLAQEGLPSGVSIDEGVRVHRLPGLTQRVPALFEDRRRRFAGPLPDPETVRALARVIEIERPQVVHAHGWMVNSFLPLKHWSRAGLAVSLHDYNLLCPEKAPVLPDGRICQGPSLAQCLRCGAAKRGWCRSIALVLGQRFAGRAERCGVDIFLPVSQAVADWSRLAASGLPFEVMPNFMHPEPADERDAAWLSQLPAEPFLLFVGALTKHKGVLVLLDAYAGLSNAPPLVLIGASRELDLSSLPRGATVLRDWPHRAVMAAWCRCLLGIVPSLWPEPYPLVALEAQAAGRPLVASHTGGLPELVLHGRTGLLVSAGDPAQLQQALRLLVTDGDLRMRMGAAALERAKTFTPDALLPRMESVYRRVAGTGR